MTIPPALAREYPPLRGEGLERKSGAGWKQLVAAPEHDRDTSAGLDAHQRSFAKAGDRPVADFRRYAVNDL